MELSRRKFIKQLSVTASSIPLLHTPFYSFQDSSDSDELEINIFSKHLQFLDYEAAGSMAAEMGFSGLDLTVRPKGHVLPESVSVDLPRAIKAINKGGAQCNMITTAIESTKNEIDKEIITVAAQSGVKHYRTNWFKYNQESTMSESLAEIQQELKNISDFNKLHNIIGSYQNHSGTNIGASFWEIKKILENVDPEYFGTQYDIRHAMAEGGQSWVNGLRLLSNDIKVIVLKDFKWGQVNGSWKPINVPVGEGMVDFKKYFKLLKAYKIKAPVSLHLEYPLGGAEKGRTDITVDEKVVYDAMTKDLSIIRKLWKEA